MSVYEKLSENLYYKRIEYKDIYTTVYLIKTEMGAMLFDCASFDYDIDDTVKPFLDSMGITAPELKYVFISHNHRDHAGGLRRFLELYPYTAVITRSSELPEGFKDYKFIIPEENQIFLDVLKVVFITGHSPCSQAIYDTRDNSMLTGDSLQLYGIFGSGEWACNIKWPAPHFEALEKLEKMDISAIYTAHDYHPLGQFYIGKEKIQEAIDACRAPLFNIMQMIKDTPSLTDEEITLLYNKDGKLPTLSLGVVKALRALGNL